MNFRLKAGLRVEFTAYVGQTMKEVAR